MNSDSEQRRRDPVVVVSIWLIIRILLLLFLLLLALNARLPTLRIPFQLLLLRFPPPQLRLPHNHRLLQDVLPFLVLLRLLERLHVLPAQPGVAGVTVDVTHDVQPCEEQPVLRGARVYVDHIREEVRPPMAALECLGDDVVVRGEVDATACAAVHVVCLDIVHEQLPHRAVDDEREATVVG
eukprot:CAMPEP_0195604288 /NCGR_PEP_ID=MMETSP0815-20121206/6565_1 /TAXON_ID=97485 /ORGANISM="Prymnesium parvum, Strain Texoma1" /LENGTH=181 /DNA_ID=CAMNT_0040743939 /DNA_START=315 /DNA_END=861 /DNA_ORIENTATION=-